MGPPLWISTAGPPPGAPHHLHLSPADRHVGCPPERESAVSGLSRHQRQQLGRRVAERQGPCPPPFDVHHSPRYMGQREALAPLTVGLPIHAYMRRIWQAAMKCSTRVGNHPRIWKTRSAAARRLAEKVGRRVPSICRRERGIRSEETWTPDAGSACSWSAALGARRVPLLDLGLAPVLAAARAHLLVTVRPSTDPESGQTSVGGQLQPHDETSTGVRPVNPERWSW